MHIHDLRCQNVVEIEVYQDGKDEVFRLHTIVDSVNKHEIRVEVPENFKTLKGITEIYVNYKENGKFRKWLCSLKGITSKKSLTLITLYSDKPSCDINRRDAFRLPYSAIAEYSIGAVDYEGIYKDISAVGICFESNEKHNLGAYGTFVFIDGSSKIDVLGEIVRVEEIPDGKYKYTYGVSIKGTDISRFVNKKQAEFIRIKKANILRGV